MNWRSTWKSTVRECEFTTPIDNIDTIDRKPDGKDSVNIVNCVNDTSTSKTDQVQETRNRTTSTQTLIDNIDRIDKTPAQGGTVPSSVNCVNIVNAPSNQTIADTLSGETLLDTEPWETFCGFVALLTRNPALWPNVKRYAERELPPTLFQSLVEEYSGRSSEPGHPQEWQSPYPARCADCIPGRLDAAGTS